MSAPTVQGRSITLDDWKQINAIGSYGGHHDEAEQDLEAELQRLFLISTDAADLESCDAADCQEERDLRYQARAALFAARHSRATRIAAVFPHGVADLSSDLPLVLPGNMTYPLSTPARISSAYGWRIHPVTQISSFHPGTDLAAPAGTPVLASLSGVVQSSGEIGNLGNAVVLDSGRTRTRYGHMSRVVVTAGEQVNQGQVLGYVGATGRTTGPHLHFELWQQDAVGEWISQDVTPTLRAYGQTRRLAQTTQPWGD